MAIGSSCRGWSNISWEHNTNALSFWHCYELITGHSSAVNSNHISDICIQTRKLFVCIYSCWSWSVEDHFRSFHYHSLLREIRFALASLKILWEKVKVSTDGKRQWLIPAILRRDWDNPCHLSPISISMSWGLELDPLLLGGHCNSTCKPYSRSTTHWKFWV